MLRKEHWNGMTIATSPMRPCGKVTLHSFWMLFIQRVLLIRMNTECFLFMIGTITQDDYWKNGVPMRKEKGQRGTVQWMSNGRPADVQRTAQVT